MSLYIGAISGTSLDGIDIALINFAQKLPDVIESFTIKYPMRIKEQLRTAIQSKSISFELLGELDLTVAKITADGVNQVLQRTGKSTSEINGIGSHGQTLFHIPGEYTLQIGDPNQIARLTGIPVVSDFRRMDIAAGGQGAPLTPLIHQALFHSYAQDTAVVNLGGIANMTILYKDKPTQVIGYDTGPANTLLDNWCEKHHKKPFDKDGKWASNGTVKQDVLGMMLKDPYFKAHSPKSTGPEYFNIDWVEKYLINTYSAQDIQATLTELTAISIANEVKKHLKYGRVLLCGGGCHNLHLVNRISRFLHDYTVMPTNEIGFDCDSLEAVFFAWLAQKRLKKELVRLEQITGSSEPVCLGGVYVP